MGSTTAENDPAISRGANIGKNVFFEQFFLSFGLSSQDAAILPTTLEFSIVHAYREIVG